jgi:hypothetical protein
MSNTTLYRRYIAIAAAASAVVASLAFSGTAQAAQVRDKKTWPATICQRWSGAGNPSASYLEVSQFGGLINKANQRLGVVCPLIRDSQSDRILDVRVWGFSPNCTAALGHTCLGLTTRCTMRVMNLTADWIRYTSTKTLTRFDPGNVRRIAAVWTNISMPDFVWGAPVQNGSSFVMFCEIGAGEHLGGFSLVEAGGEDDDD